ncbi:hypothetical protein RIF29_21904 [Crotalaria pallida]|uniref:Uncharacterized protein n=1 Tax=Crotalaria pallida TaxID=3830 RepID=A0AAN9F3Q5_CROPI
MDQKQEQNKGNQDNRCGNNGIYVTLISPKVPKSVSPLSSVADGETLRLVEGQATRRLLKLRNPNKVDLRSGELYNEEPNPSSMVVVFFSWRQHGCETEIGILDHGVQADGVMVFNLGCGALIMPMVMVFFDREI